MVCDQVGIRVENGGALSTLCHLEPFRGIPNDIPVLSIKYANGEPHDCGFGTERIKARFDKVPLYY